MIADNRVCTNQLSSCFYSGSGNIFARIISHIQNMKTQSNTPSAYKLKPMTVEKNIKHNFLSKSTFTTPFTTVSIQHPLLTLAMVSPSIFTSVLNASNVISLACFAQNPGSGPQLEPLTYTVCRQAVQSIHLNEKALAPITFSQNPDAGFRVPHTWKHENCVIIIDVVEPDAEETTTFAAVFKRAHDLSVECVIRPPHLGGRSRLGTTQKLEVLIIESSSRESPKRNKMY